MGGHCSDSPGGRMNIMVEQFGPAGVPIQVSHDHDCCCDNPSEDEVAGGGGGGAVAH